MVPISMAPPTKPTADASTVPFVAPSIYLTLSVVTVRDGAWVGVGAPVGGNVGDGVGTVVGAPVGGNVGDGVGTVVGAPVGSG